MTDIAALEIVSRFAPGMAIGDALEMVSQLKNALPAPAPRPYGEPCDPETLADAALWAERTFGPENANRKIAVIKAIRNRYELTLRESKAIADRLSFTGTGIAL